MEKDLSVLLSKLILICLVQTSVASAAHNYGTLLQAATRTYSAGARTSGSQALDQKDLQTLRSFNLMLKEFGASTDQDDSESLAQCRLHVNQTIAAFAKARLASNMWALSLLDAAGKPPSGIMNGDLIWVGNYDECVNITATIFAGPNNTKPTHPFKGRYCTAYFPLGNKTTPAGAFDPTSMMLKFGLCLPDSCSNTDIPVITQGLFPVAVCQLEDLQFDSRAQIATVFLSLLAFLVLAGTAYDVFIIHKLHVSPEEEGDESSAPLIPSVDRGDHSSSNIRYRGYGSIDNGELTVGDKVPIVKTSEPSEIGIFSRLLQAFSLYTNGSKILSTETREGVLGSINGVRFLSMSWVLLGHCYVFSLSIASNLFPFLIENFNNITFMTIYNATVSVDSFFTLSGLLVGYLTLRELQRVGSVRRFSWGMFYFHRFWRLTPPYMLMMLLYIPLLKYWYNGPFWPQQGIEVDYCESSWWRNLLYINNFFPLDDQCMAWSWYLANDMQFYVISPLFLIPLYLSSVVGFIICFIVLLAHWTLTGVVSTEHNLAMGFLGPDTKTTDFIMGTFYVRPYYRIGPYIIGLLFGAVLAKTNCKIRMSKFVCLCGWLVAAGCCLSVLYANFDVIRGKVVDSTDVVSLYNALSRSAWGLGVAWVVFACATGYGGVVNTFLSWRLFLPLSRLTYMAYLTHPIVLLVYYLGKRQAVYMTNMQMSFDFLGAMMITYAVSFVLSMVFESPFMGLERVLLKRERKH